MKKSLIVLLSILVASCTAIKPIGEIDMLCYQKLDEKANYQLIASNVGGTYKDFNETRMKGIKTIADAVKKLVDNVPGGVYLKNVKIIVVDNGLVAVQGDVWGIKSENINIKGFSNGTHVIYQKGSKITKAQVSALKDSETCFILEFGEDKPIEVPYLNLTKSSFSNEEINSYIEQRKKDKTKKTFNNMFMSTPN